MSAKEKKTEEEKLSIEEAFEKIDGIIETLEDEDIPLEEAFTQFKVGMDVVKYCEKEIGKIEKDVLKIADDGETEVFE